MREPLFLRQNKNLWTEYEDMLFQGEEDTSNPDRLAQLYIQLTDDLAYARTFYPKSQSVKYLNGLAARTHLTIYKNKKEKKNLLYAFFAEDLPLIYRRAHKYFFYSFVVFTLAFLMGYLSTLKDVQIPTLFFGADYVEMTLKNIEKGDPMGVYKNQASAEMFVSIASNNIQVAFWVFITGILCSVGAIYFIGQNGFMLGTFFGLLYNHSALGESLSVVYLHGALELSAIVIAGAAGFMLGNSIMFPGTYTRLQSLQRGAKDAIRIMIGLVPVFILAAFLESYVSRHSDMHISLKLAIILPCFAYIIWYYILYPIWVEKELKKQEVTVG
ncbi:MAG: stage II sporulation protein M [Bacteroidia bacterium]